MKSDLARNYVLIGVHKEDLARLNTFMTEGERFTLERGEGLEADLDSLTDEHDALRLVVSENKLVVARMPHQLVYPFSREWQAKVSENSKAIAINTSRLDELNRK